MLTRGNGWFWSIGCWVGYRGESDGRCAGVGALLPLTLTESVVAGAQPPLLSRAAAAWAATELLPITDATAMPAACAIERPGAGGGASAAVGQSSRPDASEIVAGDDARRYPDGGTAAGGEASLSDARRSTRDPVCGAE